MSGQKPAISPRPGQNSAISPIRQRASGGDRRGPPSASGGQGVLSQRRRIRCPPITAKSSLGQPFPRHPSDAARDDGKPRESSSQRHSEDARTRGESGRGCSQGVRCAPRRYPRERGRGGRGVSRETPWNRDEDTDPTGPQVTQRARSRKPTQREQRVRRPAQRARKWPGELSEFAGGPAIPQPQAGPTGPQVTRRARSHKPAARLPRGAEAHPRPRRRGATPPR